jgi:ribosome-binding protein aMBF1 (putative translation factor)
VDSKSQILGPVNVNLESMATFHLARDNPARLAQRITRRKATAYSRALGSRVRSLRRTRKWSLEELSHRAGMHVTYLSSVEHGQRNPTLNVLMALAQALSVPLSELVEGIEKAKQ